MNNLSTNYYSKEVHEVLLEFTSRKEGLTNSEATVRQMQHGLNKLPEVKQRALYLRFFDQFKDGLIILLLIAGFISFVRGDFNDGIIILVIVFLNAAISLIQEYKAEKSLQALKGMMAPLCIVMRDSKQQQIKAETLVPGDILVLEEGAKVPADCRIIDDTALMADEAALTGESMPVSKHSHVIKNVHIELAEQKNMLFMGTNIAHGRCTAIVIATGKDTEFGKIARITQELGEQVMPLTLELNKVGKFVARLALVVCIIIFTAGIVGLIKIPELLVMGFWDRILYMFSYVVSVAVAIVPEGLAATVTIALALGVRRMAKKKAIVRKLQAVEALGYTTTICSDKTGTLTKNQMTVINIFANGQNINVSGTGYQPDGNFTISNSIIKDAKTYGALTQVIEASFAASNAKLFAPDREHKDWYIIGDPTEGALITVAKKFEPGMDERFKTWKHCAEFSFDSQRRRMTTIYQKPSNSKRIAFSKGASDAVLEHCVTYLKNGKTCVLTQADKKALHAQSDKYASQGLRVLAIASRELPAGKQDYTESAVESKMTFLGFVAMRDPPRDEIKESVALCKTAGIKVYIITGDAGATARAIASEVGIASKDARIITGNELDNLSDEEITVALQSEVIFARTSPVHKMRIVNILKQNGERVAVTGDGFNDAPALKAADVGIAMGISGTDVAKESADMVLVDDSFATIAVAIKEGRGVYDNIKKTVQYAFTGIGAELLVVLFAIFAALPLPITAIQILWIDLGSEVFPGLALGVDKINDSVMKKKPRKKDDKIMTHNLVFNVIRGALFIALVVCILFVNTYVGTPESLIKAQTIAFSMIIFMQMFNTFNCRDNHESIFTIGFFSNWTIFPAIGTSILLTVLMIQLPILQPFLGTTSLTAFDWVIMAGCSIAMLAYGELYKLGMRIMHKRKNVI